MPDKKARFSTNFDKKKQKNKNWRSFPDIFFYFWRIGLKSITLNLDNSVHESKN